MNVDQKRCKKCLEIKNIEEDFYFVNGWRRSTCKECFKSRVLENTKKTEEKQKQIQGEEYVSYNSKYNIENREKILQHRKDFKERHPHYARDIQRKHAVLKKAKKAEE